jgi:hypothetical protein
MRSLTVLLALILTAVLLLALQASFGSASNSSGQHAVEDWIASDCPTVPPDGKPPEQAILRPAVSEAEEEIGRQIAQLVLEAQEEGRALHEEQLRPLFEQLAPDGVVILGAEDSLGDSPSEAERCE